MRAVKLKLYEEADDVSAALGLCPILTAVRGSVDACVRRDFLDGNDSCRSQHLRRDQQGGAEADPRAADAGEYAQLSNLGEDLGTLVSAQSAAYRVTSPEMQNQYFVYIAAWHYEYVLILSGYFGSRLFFDCIHKSGMTA